ncbi:MAG: transglycosylase SLT domain-containing protein [Magnetococcales bacterium]|nr:transglycosylase SLT domain-containing protein [Magnetococcales bacterium]
MPKPPLATTLGVLFAFLFVGGGRPLFDGGVARAQGGGASVLGEKASVQGAKATSTGKKATPQGKHGIAQGKKSDAQGKKSVAQGKKSDAQGKKSASQGKGSVAQGKKSPPGQRQAVVQGKQAVAPGRQHAAPVALPSTLTGSASLPEAQVPVLDSTTGRPGEGSIAAYKRLFASLEGGVVPATLLDRRWPRDELLASYLELEILFHPGYSATAADFHRFVSRWPDHPEMARIAPHYEATLTRSGSDAQARAWYRAHPPRQYAGKMRSLKLKLQDGLIEEARSEWGTYYREGAPLPIGAEKLADRFLQSMTAEDHEARARKLAAKGDRKTLEATLRLLPKARQDYFLALAAVNDSDAVFNGLVKHLDRGAATSPELWKARFQALQKSGRHGGTAALLQSEVGRRLGAADRQEIRYILGRELLYSADNPQAAKAMLAANFNEAGGTLEDSLWIYAWSSYRTGDRKEALKAFLRLALEAPGRDRRSQGAYMAAWLLKRHPDLAASGVKRELWLDYASRYPETFYGLLALEERNQGLPPLTLPSTVCQLPDLPELRKAEEDMRHLEAVDRSYYNGPIIKDLAKRLGLTPRQEICLAARHGAPNHAVVTATSLDRQGEKEWKGLYPLPPWQPGQGWLLKPEVVWAVTRQESLYQNRAASWVGASGLMQLMPATAKGEAALIGLPSSNPVRLQRPAYNLSLGQSYMARLLRKFDSDVVLSLIGYNAGPGRAARYLGKRQQEDPLVFIENFPITETREYIKKVSLNLALYRLVYQGRSSLHALIRAGGPGIADVAGPDWELVVRK